MRYYVYILSKYILDAIYLFIYFYNLHFLRCRMMEFLFSFKINF